MLEKIKEIVGRTKGGLDKWVINRNINDITIHVEEGLDNTRKITVTNWNPEIAFNLFKMVRDELRENPRGSKM